MNVKIGIPKPKHKQPKAHFYIAVTSPSSVGNIRRQAERLGFLVYQDNDNPLRPVLSILVKGNGLKRFRQRNDGDLTALGFEYQRRDTQQSAELIAEHLKLRNSVNVYNRDFIVYRNMEAIKRKAKPQNQQDTPAAPVADPPKDVLVNALT